MKISLLHATPIEVADLAISKCWDKTTDKPKERMYRVANKFKHASTIEHVSFSFDIDGISRACLQEVARHRMASLSVKSTRYTLKELGQASSNYESFLVQTGEDYVDAHNVETLKYISSVIREGGLSNDKTKYLLPEAYKTSLVMTINMRSLQNFLSLRTDKAALWEIRQLAYNMFSVIPTDYRFMLEDFVKDNNDDI